MTAVHPLTIVMYHFVRPIAAGPFPRMRGLEVEAFAGQLDHLARHYNFVTMAQVLKALADEGRGLPPRPLMLQFDDGYKDHSAIAAPILNSRGLQGAFYPVAATTLERKLLTANMVQFALASCDDIAELIGRMEDLIRMHGPAYNVPSLDELRETHRKATRLDTADVIYVKRLLQTGLPEKLRETIARGLFASYVTEDGEAFADNLYMSADDLRGLLADGHHVGSHSDTHPWLTSLSGADLRDELARGLRLLDAVGVPRKGFTFCYPYGGFNAETERAVAELGCAAAFTANVAIAPLSADTRLRIPRLDTIDLPFAAEAEPCAFTRAAMQDLNA